MNPAAWKGNRETGRRAARAQRPERAGGSCAILCCPGPAAGDSRETTTVTGRSNAERLRPAAPCRGAAFLATCAVVCLSFLVPAARAYGQRGGRPAAMPRMAARPMPAQRAMPRSQMRAQRQFEQRPQRAFGERGQRPAPGYRQPEAGRAQQNFARPGGQAGAPRPAYNGARPEGAARPEYPGAGTVRPALPGNTGQYAFPPGHLGSWLNQHRNFAGQEQLLRNDPNFNRLPPADQQRLIQQLRQVNQLPPGERERRLERAEKIEHMTPQERMQLAQSTRALRALPPDRQARVSQAFRDLRGVPVDQRQTVIDSERYRSQFSPEERGILTNLLRAEPYEPAQ